MILGQASYRSVLKEVLVERISRNPAYSVRAFARSLEVAPSFLSEVLKGQKNFSPEAGLRVAKKLGLSQEENEYFCLLVQLESSKDPDFRASILDKLRELKPSDVVHDLDVDQFRVIAEWYHLPILELTFLRGFKFGPKEIAARLAISEHEASSAIERLIRLGLLERSPDGRFRKTKGRSVFQSRVPTRAAARFHRQILEKLQHQLEIQRYPERISATNVYPVDPKRLPEIEATIDRCVAELVRISDSSARAGTLREVYAFSAHFFNLTRERASAK